MDDIRSLIGSQGTLVYGPDGHQVTLRLYDSRHHTDIWKNLSNWIYRFKKEEDDRAGEDSVWQLLSAGDDHRWIFVAGKRGQYRARMIITTSSEPEPDYLRLLEIHVDKPYRYGPGKGSWADCITSAVEEAFGVKVAEMDIHKPLITAAPDMERHGISCERDQSHRPLSDSNGHIRLRCRSLRKEEWAGWEPRSVVTPAPDNLP